MNTEWVNINTLLIAVAVNWGLPLVASWAYILWLRFISHDIKFVKWEQVGFIPIARWQLISKYSWYAKLWQDWYGVGLPGNLIHRDEDGEDDDMFVEITVTHELRHCWQWLVLGLLQAAFYLGHFAYLLVTQWVRMTVFKQAPTKHPYLDNWAERDARRYAGQAVDVPPGNWPQGPKDLNPWAFNPSREEIQTARRLWWATELIS